MRFSRLSCRFLLLLLIPATALPVSLVEDRQMERAARSSYIYSTVLQGRVKAAAEFGVLTLTGTVEEPGERLLAEDLARSLPWVEGVANKITIQPSQREKSDPWIRLRILARLRLRSGVNAETTRVTVMDGMVTLTGTVRTPRQKELTEQIADDIVGVHHVRNNLVVTPPAPGETVPDVQVDDPSITAQVIAVLRQNAGTQLATVKVTTTEGAVRLTGECSSETQKALITQLTREVYGVRFVNNSLQNSPLATTSR